MTMLKVVAPTEEYFGDAISSMVKISSRGLIGYDKRQLFKRASHSFLDFLSTYKPEPGEVLVHQLALGATEKYGANRNADGFKEATCRDCHPTFVKHAYAYREHANKDRTKSYGRVKASAYNDPMSRVELITSLNGTKELAQKRGGLVADLEIEDLEKKGTYDDSMACLVDYDVCSGCGHKARNRSEYCNAGMCVKYGGCQNNLGKTFDDGHTLHVDNPNPRWFDISRVGRGADRIARALGKVASAGLAKGGAAIAEELGLSAPSYLLKEAADGSTGRLLDLLDQLVAVEKKSTILPRDVDRFFAFTPPAPSEMPDLRQHKLAKVMRALASHTCMLPLESFFSLLAPGKDVDTEKIAQWLPGAFGRLADDPNVVDLLAAGTYAADPLPAPVGLDRWAAKQADAWSLELKPAEKRAHTAVLRNISQPKLRVPLLAAPRNSAEKAAAALAREYALYQLNFLDAARGQSKSADLLTTLAVRQNFIKREQNSR